MPNQRLEEAQGRVQTSAQTQEARLQQGQDVGRRVVIRFDEGRRPPGRARDDLELRVIIVAKEKKDWRKTTLAHFHFHCPKLFVHFTSHVAEDDAQDTLRAAADQAALEDAAREFRGVGAASLFEFSDLAAPGRVYCLAEAEVGEQHRGPLYVAVEQRNLDDRDGAIVTGREEEGARGSETEVAYDL